MDKSLTKAWLVKMFADKGATLPSNALSAAFHLALERMVERGIPGRMHEEPTTSFMLGAIASLVDVCSDAYLDEDQGRCAWQYYPKAGEISEKVTGADFAVVIELPDAPLRVAIFQAKREQGAARSTFKVHQVRSESETETGISQFTRFLGHARKIQDAANQGQELEKIHWAHYLVYSSTAMQCVALKHLGAVERDYLQNRTPPPVSVLEHSSFNFKTLLSTAATQSDSSVLDGWLNLHVAASEAKRSLVQSFDVYMARRGLGLNFEDDPDFQIEPLQPAKLASPASQPPPSSRRGKSLGG